jgi:hypothetical protein
MDPPEIALLPALFKPGKSPDPDNRRLQEHLACGSSNSRSDE